MEPSADSSLARAELSTYKFRAQVFGNLAAVLYFSWVKNSFLHGFNFLGAAVNCAEKSRER